jgi:hypothetical protein
MSLQMFLAGESLPAVGTINHLGHGFYLHLGLEVPVLAILMAGPYATRANPDRPGWTV